MPKRVLVVDDEPDIRKVVSFRLKKAGYEVTTAVNGKEALECVQKERPDLILLDLRLPIMDGYEVCKRLKSDEVLKSIPVILLTASMASTVREKTKEYNADDYMVKPFDPDKLMEKIKKFIS